MLINPPVRTHSMNIFENRKYLTAYSTRSLSNLLEIKEYHWKLPTQIQLEALVFYSQDPIFIKLCRLLSHMA